MGSQMLLGCMFLGLSNLVQSQQQTSPPPVRVASSIAQSNGLTCPSPDISAYRELIEQGMEDYYQSYSIPSTYNVSSCPCGGTGGWTRAVYLNMSDMNQQCPSAWNLTATPIRGCGRTNGNERVCDSVTYPVHGLTYSRVCGRILAYQRGQLSAFYPNVVYGDTLEQAYLSGLSLTHGQPGSRQHIWSFVGGPHNGGSTTQQCPCNVMNYPYQIPFVNNSYFCESGNPGSTSSITNYFTDNPLWDGQGCDTSSTCCDFNNPPWFCTSLSQPTNEDLEIRSCHAFGSNFEDTIITLMSIYVK